MSTTTEQDKKFLKEVIGLELLEKTIEWIRDNMQPSEVFNDSTLCVSVQSSCTPSEVFSDKELGEWAEANGYVAAG